MVGGGGGAAVGALIGHATGSTATGRDHRRRGGWRGRRAHRPQDGQAGRGAGQGPARRAGVACGRGHRGDLRLRDPVPVRLRASCRSRGARTWAAGRQPGAEPRHRDPARRPHRLRGRLGYNQQLSERRARTAADYLARRAWRVAAADHGQGRDRADRRQRRRAGRSRTAASRSRSTPTRRHASRPAARRARTSSAAPSRRWPAGCSARTRYGPRSATRRDSGRTRWASRIASAA